jgi:hypothetical protein
MVRSNGIPVAAIVALLFATAGARPCRAQATVGSRDYVEMEGIEDPAFQAFWNEFRAAVVGRRWQT